MGGLVRHGQEAILCGGGQIQDFAACHHVIIHVNRVDRVGNENRVILTEQIQQVAQIALGTVGNENFRHIQLDAVACVILADGLAQELITLLAGNVAVEGALVALLLHRLMHSLGHRGCQRQGDIADAQTDDVGFGMGLLVVGHLVGDGAEQIALVQLCVMRIQLHGWSPSFFTFI